MTLEAKNKSGIWQALSGFSNSWCGNSFHKVNMPPNQYWQAALPIMQGDFKTKLRVKFSTKKKAGQEFISNEFDGAINSSQFWRYASHFSYPVMEVYKRRD
jgi:hypothetical protein